MIEAKVDGKAISIVDIYELSTHQPKFVISFEENEKETLNLHVTTKGVQNSKTDPKWIEDIIEVFSRGYKTDLKGLYYEARSMQNFPYGFEVFVRRKENDEGSVTVVCLDIMVAKETSYDSNQEFVQGTFGKYW